MRPTPSYTADDAVTVDALLAHHFYDIASWRCFCRCNGWLCWHAVYCCCYCHRCQPNSCNFSLNRLSFSCASRKTFFRCLCVAPVQVFGFFFGFVNACFCSVYCYLFCFGSRFFSYVVHENPTHWKQPTTHTLTLPKLFAHFFGYIYKLFFVVVCSLFFNEILLFTLFFFSVIITWHPPSVRLTFYTRRTLTYTENSMESTR